MGHIYLSHSHPIAIYACPIPSHGTFPIPMDKPAKTYTRIFFQEGIHYGKAHKYSKETVNACRLELDRCIGRYDDVADVSYRQNSADI